MKLIPNFYELLQKDELPIRYRDWWILEDKDYHFDTDFYREKGIYTPLQTSSKYDYFDARGLIAFLKDARKGLGFFRQKNTQKDLEDQKIFMEQFDYDLIQKTFNLANSIRERRIAQDDIDEWKSIYKDGMNGEELDTAKKRKRLDEQLD